MIQFIVQLEEVPGRNAMRIHVSTPASAATQAEMDAGRDFKEMMTTWHPTAHNKAVTLRNWGTTQEGN